MSSKLWDTIFVDANLATMVPETSFGIIENAAIAIAKGKIAWLGPMVELTEKPQQLAKHVHSLNKRWLTPGLIDCHTHLVYAGNRANEFEMRLSGKSYTEIAQAGGGIRATVAATRAASEEELFIQSEKRLLALLSEGITTIEIKSGYGLNTETELKILRVARSLAASHPVTIKTTLLGAHALPDEFTQRSDDYIDYVCNNMLPAAYAAGLVDAVDVFCETIAFSPAQTERVFQAAKQYNLPVKIHAEQLSNQQGAKLAAKYQALSADHLEWADEQSIQAMATSGMTAVLLPGAFYFLNETKKPPINLLRSHKVPMAISSDCNPGTSPVTSLLTMLNMACILFSLTPIEALAGVTKNAAKALGIASTHGTLEVGKHADFVVWDITNPRDLSYQIGMNSCFEVIKNGKFIYI